MLVCSAAVVVVSLLLPWFGGRVSFSFVQFYGFELGFVLFCTVVVGATIGLGVWCSWIGRARFVVWLSLAASVATVLFAGFILTLSSSLSRVASVAGLSDVVGIRVRPGVPTLLMGGLLGMVGSVTVLALWRARSAAAAGSASLEEPRWDDDGDDLQSLPDEDDFDYAFDRALPLLADDEDDW